MASAVLFDSPGPKTVRRHRIYTGLSLVVVLAVLAFVLLRLRDAGQFEYAKWEPLLTPQYLEALLEGLVDTLKMAFTSIILAVVAGVLFGVGKLSDHAWLRWPCWAVVELCRAVPVLLMMVFFFYVARIAGGVANGETGAYWSVVAALTVYNGAVLAEVFRAGILAVPKGQSEAGYAIGMRKSQVMSVVLLPQGVKIMLPAIISQCVVALKDTSLGYAIAAPALSKVGQSIFQQFNNALPTVFVVAVMYIAVNYVLTLIATWVQHRLVGERKQLEVGMVGGPAPDKDTV
ncbi:amino acid ABC transporter permease [Nocardioides sp. cx-169]|uniref:amino acid ABC transporter permease n=1 Tax=Nocardioides sp. cx-169 TaxID=2899080 RepID=UPI001E44B7BC|nr:amino acid ABC transporter permease [Nocardioides sp. cx-169]MCD4532541.1 amino acid ABC transporter permease [Nocardioides sp. cx-169]